MRQSPCIPDQLPAIAVLSRTGVDQWDQRKQWIDYAQRNRAERARGYASLVDFDIGLGKAAANVDRTAQRHGTGVLGFPAIIRTKLDAIRALAYIRQMIFIIVLGLTRSGRSCSRR